MKQMPKSVTGALNKDKSDCSLEKESTAHDSEEEKLNKAEMDKGKNKFLYSKDLVGKFPHAQKTFKHRLET